MRHLLTVSINGMPPDFGMPERVTSDGWVGEALNCDDGGGCGGGGGVAT